MDIAAHIPISVHTTIALFQFKQRCHIGIVSHLMTEIVVEYTNTGMDLNFKARGLHGSDQFMGVLWVRWCQFMAFADIAVIQNGLQSPAALEYIAVDHGVPVIKQQ